MKLEVLEKELNSLVRTCFDKWMTEENIQYFLNQNRIKFRFEPKSSLGERGKIILINGKWIYRYGDAKPGNCVRLLF